MNKVILSLLFSTALFTTFNATAEVTTIQTKENLKSYRPLKCMDLATVNNKHTPADLFIGVKNCIKNKNFSNATNLFLMALVYGRYDMQRVEDKTAHQALGMLKYKLSLGLSPEEVKLFDENYKKLIKNKNGFCSVIKKPDYYPSYMIQHGIHAVNGANSGITKDFDSDKAWNEIFTKYLKCSEHAKDKEQK